MMTKILNSNQSTPVVKLKPEVFRALVESASEGVEFTYQNGYIADVNMQPLSFFWQGVIFAEESK